MIGQIPLRPYFAFFTKQWLCTL